MRLHPSVLLLALGAASELPVPLPAAATPLPPAPVRVSCPHLTDWELRALEARPGEVDSAQFSTTTKLKGIASFSIGGSGTLAEAPPATVDGSSFSTTTKLKAEIVWRPLSSACTGQGAGSEASETSENRQTASLTRKDRMANYFNMIRVDNGMSPIPPPPPQVYAHVDNEYLGKLADPILRGAKDCDHDHSLWEQLTTWGSTQGVFPRSELLTCKRSKGGGWEPTVAEQWRNSPIHFHIILKKADYLGCHRRVQGEEEFEICITWMSSGETATPTPPIEDKSSPEQCTTSLLSWYVFLPSCIQQARDAVPVE